MSRRVKVCLVKTLSMLLMMLVLVLLKEKGMFLRIEEHVNRDASYLNSLCII